MVNQEIIRNAKIFGESIKKGLNNFYGIPDQFVRKYLLEEFIKEYKNNELNDKGIDALLSFYIIYIKLYRKTFNNIPEDIHHGIIDKINELGNTSLSYSDKDKAVEFIKNNIDFNDDNNYCLYVK